MGIEVNLRIPGPIPVPTDILEVMSSPMTNHRGSQFKKILYRITDRLKTIFETSGSVYILTSSGTGAMEAAVTNTLSPGDTVLCTSVGSFGNRFGQIAKNFGANVIMLTFENGTAVDVAEMRQVLEKTPDVKAVLVTHNETNTGVTNDLEAIAGVVKGEFDKLLLVDGISSVCSIPLRTDAWQCDVVVSASQKGWMLPPGLAFISFSERAWDAYASAKMPRFYFDLAQYKEYLAIGQPPWTPAISVFYALDIALEKLILEGLPNIYKRHAHIAQMTREGIKSLGLSLFAEESVASDTVTSVIVPDGVDSNRMMRILQSEYGVVLAGAYGDLSGKMFRIGHLGCVTEGEITDVLDGLSAALPKAGFLSP